MRKLKILICLYLIFVLSSTGLLPSVKASSAAEASDFAPGKVIVGVEEITVEIIEALKAKGGTIGEKIPALKAIVVQVTAGKEEEFIKSVRGISGFKYAERNGIVQAVYTPNDRRNQPRPALAMQIVQVTYTPNDPRWGELWNMRKIKADMAWDIHKGTMSITVAIVDSGVDYNHKDLAAHYVPGGYDWVNNDPNPWDDFWHGTHCAGIAAAVMDNGVGVVGVAQVGILAQKVLNQFGYGYWDDVAQGIVNATDNGVEVISMSLGGYEYSSLVNSACQYAWNHGVLIVAAAGNDNLDIDIYKFYPACYSTVMAVSATTSADLRASWSNYGSKIELAAPGEGVLSTTPGNSYGYASGTSMACPHVSGLAALTWSYIPSLTNQQLRDRLHKGVDDLGIPGKDEYYGYGRINAYKALTVTQRMIEHTYTFSIAPGGSWNQYSELSDDVFGSTTGVGYVDKYIMTLTTTTFVHIEVEDVGLMGDTIALGVSATKYWSATSPAKVIVEGTLGPGTYTFYIGYIKPNNGVFPAGYNIYVTGS